MRYLPAPPANAAPLYVLYSLHLPSSAFHSCFICGFPPNCLRAFSCFSWLLAACLVSSLIPRPLEAQLADRQPVAEALAVKGDRIVALGAAAEINPHIGPSTRVIELAGRMAMPGFIEGHGHFLSLGDSKRKLDLSQAASWDEIVALVAKEASKTPPGQWIVGRGWHQGKWKMPPTPHVQGYPTHDALSRVTPNHPVLLTHGTGHMAFANAKAMELAGVTK